MRKRLPDSEISRNRRGVATLWLILALPLFLIILGALLEIANLWLARIELKNGLDAASLAAVKEWAESPGGTDTQPARAVGVNYATANDSGGQPIPLATNYDAGGGVNENATNDDGLIFGAVDVSDLTDIVFDAGLEPSCISGEVRVDIYKSGSNGNTTNRLIGIIYEEGDPNTYIRRVSITIPEFAVSNNQHPYFEGTATTAPNGQKPVVSITNLDDVLNPGSPTPVVLNGMPGVTTRDIRGMDPSATFLDGGNPQNGSVWSCPNPNGDICFTFSDQVAALAGRYRTININFSDNTFNSPVGIATDANREFVRVGAAVNNLGPPAVPGGQNNNDGDNFGIVGAVLTVEFVNNSTNTSEICTSRFVDTNEQPFGTDMNGSDNQSIAICGSASQSVFGVRAQSNIPVNSLFWDLFGLPLGPYAIEAKSDAMYDCQNGSPRLVHINQFIPGP